MLVLRAQIIDFVKDNYNRAIEGYMWKKCKILIGYVTFRYKIFELNVTRC